MSRPARSWQRRLARFLGVSTFTRPGARGAAISAFFPSGSRSTPAKKCPNCDEESPAGSERCLGCGHELKTISRPDAVFIGAPRLPLWLFGIWTVLLGGSAFWLGREAGRAAALRTAGQNNRVASAPAATPRASATVAPTPVDPVATATGATWAIYTSRDRLTDRALFGARFGTASGTPLFSALCADGRAAISLKRGLLPAHEGASGDVKALVSTIEVAIRLAKREREQVRLRFEDAAPETLNAIPARPLDFLRRVAASRRIRTASDDFDPAPWSEAIARVVGECRFEGPSGSAPRQGTPRR